MLELPPHLHPMVVHFPIALFLTALVFDVFSFIVKKESFHRSALAMYVLAALLTPLVLRTGIWEATKLGLSHPLLDQHRQYATWLMWFSLVSLPVLWFLKKEFNKYYRLVFVVCLLGTAVLVSMTADKGGDMVYKYGVGVE